MLQDDKARHMICVQLGGLCCCHGYYDKARHDQMTWVQLGVYVDVMVIMTKLYMTKLQWSS